MRSSVASSGAGSVSWRAGTLRRRSRWSRVMASRGFAEAVTDKVVAFRKAEHAFRISAFSPEMTRDSDIPKAAPGRVTAPRAAARVLETLRHDAVTGLGGVLSGFWSSIEEQVRL